MKNMEEYLEAIDLFEKRKFNEALKKLEEVREKNPSNIYIEFNIARIKARNKNTRTEAKELFKKMLKENKRYSSAALLEIGKIEVLEGKYDKAKSRFNKLIKRENDFLAYIQLAKLENRFRNFDEARNLLKTVIDSNNEHSSLALFELGKLERKVGNISQAINCFEQIPKDSPDIDINWLNLELAKIELLTGDFDNGMNILRSLLGTRIRTEALEEIVKFYIRNEKYDLAHQYNKELEKCFFNKLSVNPKQIDEFLQYKRGILQKDLTDDTYFQKQLYTYSKEEAIKHIKMHLDDNEEKMLHTIFSEAIDIEELYEFMYENIKDMNPCEGLLNDEYIVRYTKIVGTAVNGSLTDTVRVKVIPNTKDILTIYPIPAENGQIKIEQEKVKEKVIESPIDKFNRRYSKNSF